mgnify:CR=1 FL=1
MTQRSELTAEALRAAPPVTVAGATIAGVPLNDLILWATLLYLVLQIGFLLYRWWTMHTLASAQNDKDSLSWSNPEWRLQHWAKLADTPSYSNRPIINPLEHLVRAFARAVRIADRDAVFAEAGGDGRAFTFGQVFCGFMNSINWRILIRSLIKLRIRIIFKTKIFFWYIFYSS